jgi:hypothetical protein
MFGKREGNLGLGRLLSRKNFQTVIHSLGAGQQAPFANLCVLCALARGKFCLSDKQISRKAAKNAKNATSHALPAGILYHKRLSAVAKINP